MFAEIIIDSSNSFIDKTYDYIIPENLNVKIGNRVMVSFGKQIIQGFVVNIKDSCDYQKSKLKEISSVVEERPVILPEMIQLMNFMVDKYHIRKIDALRLFLPAEMRKDEVKSLEKIICKLNIENIDELINKLRKNAKNQIELLNYLKNKKFEEKTVLNGLFTSSAVNKFINKKIIIQEKIIKNRNPEFLNINNSNIKFNNEQKNAINIISKPGKYLLFGVTGSGKTEVYMSLIEKTIKQNKTAIMLVPEISLTPQIFSKFKSRFGELVAVLHSGLSAGERFDEWKRLFSGEAKIVVGARSAIFAPLENIGVIIVDEEHDGSYQSESNPRFNTKEIAEFRQNFNNSILVLGSATPELDTYKKTENNYTLVELPKRANNKEMPKVQIVDMITELHRGNTSPFSYALMEELQKVIDTKKQAMIFINRRGFSSFMRCNQCGYIAKCTDCDVSLVYHKDEEKLKCHYCGKRYKALTKCPNCASENIRQGAIGTQKVVEELQKKFNVPVFRMDNDTTSNKNSHIKILSEFSSTKPSILVGTQMIAKGHDFKDVVLVGIIDADQTLYQSNYKSTERTFELVTQVAGRAGRSEDEGKVILQTYSPKHYVYKFVSNYNYKGFYDKEINLREVTKFPPFYKIVRILFSNSNEELVRELAKKCYSDIIEIKNKYITDFVYLEAMKSPLTKIKNAFRYQILARFAINREEEIIKEIYKVCDKYQNSKVSLFVEINPQNLY